MATKTTYRFEAPTGETLEEVSGRAVGAAVLVFTEETGPEVPPGITSGAWTVFSVSKNATLAGKTMATWKARQPGWKFTVVEAV